MDTSGLLSAWWMPKEEEDLWNISRALALQKIMFITGIFVICNSLSHSLVRLFFDKTSFTPADHVWLPHRFVELFNATATFIYGLILYTGWLDNDHSFLSDRVFAFSSHQDLLTNAQIAYSLYSIGISLSNFTAFGRGRVWLNLMRGSVTIGMNYLYFLFPCVLGARLRIYWSVLEIAVSMTAATNLLQYLRLKPKTLALLSIVSMVLCMVRVWMWMCSLLWAFTWVSENVWHGMPSEVPVAELTNAYLTGTGVGAIGLSYFAFVDFRFVIQTSKEWSEKFTKRSQ